MYNRVGRGLLIVGRQIRQKLCENTSASKAAVGCTAAAVIHSPPGIFITDRNYCNKTTDDQSVTPPTLLSPDEEAEAKLKEFYMLPENERLKKIIELEIDLMRQNCERVPTILKPRHWFELLKLDSRSKRRRYLEYIFGLEKRQENIKRAKDERQKRHDEEKANPSGQDDNPYKLGKNTMFLRYYDTTINHMYHNRLMKSMMFGQQIVMDCGYEKYMHEREVRNCARQMQLSFAANRIHDDPFDLYFCNANIHGELMKHFNRFIPPMYNPEFPINIKTESYLDIFDKNKLIYLTPHCKQEMGAFDHDAIYIIGAFVDKSTNEPLSMAKAKKEGLRMLKFPLDRYLQWGSSSGKNLTLNQVLTILLDLRLTGSWEKALKHVPRRKLYEARIDQQNHRLQNICNGVFSDNVENSTRPLQEIKQKERFIYKPDRSHRPKVDRDYKSNSFGVRKEIPQQDFSIKSRAKFKHNWEN